MPVLTQLKGQKGLFERHKTTITHSIRPKIENDLSLWQRTDFNFQLSEKQRSTQSDAAVFNSWQVPRKSR